MRHVKETSGMGERGDDWNEEKKAVKEAVDAKDTVTMDIPLLIRVLEYAREDAKTDMDLHKVVENLINMRGDGALSMEMYNKIVAIKEAIEESDSTYGKRADALLAKSHSAHRAGDKETGSRAHKLFLKARDKNWAKPEVEKEVIRRQGASIAKDYQDQEKRRGVGNVRDHVEVIGTVVEADEAKYGEKYQAAVKRVGQKAAQKPVDMKSLAARMQASYAKDKKPLKELKKQDDNQELDAHITREEVEELSELSKGTLKSYISKRGETIHADKADSNVARNRAADLEYRGKQAQADTNHDEADRLHQSARKGATNVTKAAIKVAKKTNEEVEQLEELNRDTLHSYEKKSQADSDKQHEIIGKSIMTGDAKTGNAAATKAKSRYQGLMRANKRLAKEEVEQIEEASTLKQQSMKSARMIKSLYKKKLKESTYDWEKDDKGGKKTTAKITVKGGTTMTGKPRDTVEIEPILKTRPNGAGGMKSGV
jgi:hypothetical protein